MATARCKPDVRICREECLQAIADCKTDVGIMSRRLRSTISTTSGMSSSRRTRTTTRLRLWSPCTVTLIVQLCITGKSSSPTSSHTSTSWKLTTSIRMYVLESSGSDIWDSSYKMKAQLNTFDQFAIDGTYFQHQDNLYHVYSCWYSALQSWPANLCITKSRSRRPHHQQTYRKC